MGNAMFRSDIDSGLFREPATVSMSMLLPYKLLALCTNVTPNVVFEEALDRMPKPGEKTRAVHAIRFQNKIIRTQ